MIISLCGFMGAGKSTIGRHLSRFMGCDLIDLDAYIEKKLGTKISEIFKANGEEYFRTQEHTALQEIIEKYLQSPQKNLILSLGGGTVTIESCARLIKENTFCIYLYCPKHELIKRLKRNMTNRPLLHNKSDKELENHISSLMQQRESIYKTCAHRTINTGNRKLQDVIEDILNNLN